MRANNLVEELGRLSLQSLFTLVPLTGAFLLTGYFSNSLTIVSVALDSGFAIIVLLFYYISVRAMRSADPIRFPHGTGKLENFSGFLYGALTVPIAVYIFFAAVSSLLQPPEQVQFNIAQLPMVPSLIRSIYFYMFARRLARSYASPLVDSFVANFRVSTWFDLLVITAMALGFVLERLGAGDAASRVDSLFSLGISLYMLGTAASELTRNFRVLIDLPMPEEDQLAIIRALAAEFESYEQIGVIRTRRSGMHRLIDVELFFSRSVEVSIIAALNQRLEDRLKQSLGDIRLHIVVREMPAAA